MYWLEQGNAAEVNDTWIGMSAKQLQDRTQAHDTQIQNAKIHYKNISVTAAAC